ncbi:conserved hypothetical protein [Culex quinquefasciatus]|uniref:DOMON domain-containing protein n=1 Tax=Culex quinquefasciatus TaxID=7176 RepID=B0XDZ3_CULQU|nr:conserved hypothetical protein [Culex quinquefasciatus]|eukprot:XP_001867865.1 conserved hypothetical protein [Culex quinquefasciatus]
MPRATMLPMLLLSLCGKGKVRAPSETIDMGKLSNYLPMLVALVLVVAAVGVEAATAIEPVRHKWTRSEIMDANGLYLLEWKVDHKDIVFTVTVNTRGFIGLGFSHKSERMSGSDLVLAWVDDRTGKPSVLTRITHQ